MMLPDGLVTKVFKCHCVFTCSLLCQCDSPSSLEWLVPTERENCTGCVTVQLVCIPQSQCLIRFLLFLFQGDQTGYMINVTCWGWLVFDVNAAHDIHARLFIPHQTWRMFRLSHISVQIHNFLYESPCWSEPGIIKPDFEQIRFWLKVSLFVWSLSSVHERWSRLMSRGSGCIACGLIVKHIYHLHHVYLWNLQFFILFV